MKNLLHTFQEQLGLHDINYLHFGWICTFRAVYRIKDYSDKKTNLCEQKVGTYNKRIKGQRAFFCKFFILCNKFQKKKKNISHWNISFHFKYSSSLGLKDLMRCSFCFNRSYIKLFFVSSFSLFSVYYYYLLQLQCLCVSFILYSNCFWALGLVWCHCAPQKKFSYEVVSLAWPWINTRIRAHQFASVAFSH